MPLLVAVDTTPVLKLWLLYGAGSLPVASKAWLTWVTSRSLEKGGSIVKLKKVDLPYPLLL